MALWQGILIRSRCGRIDLDWVRDAHAKIFLGLGSESQPKIQLVGLDSRLHRCTCDKLVFCDRLTLIKQVGADPRAYGAQRLYPAER